MSLFNQIKKMATANDVTPENLEAEFFSLFEQLNNKFQEPKNWTPTISSTMTLSAITIAWARYEIIGRRCFFDVAFSCTTAGAASTIISFTPPPGLKPIATVNIGDGCRVGDVTSLAGTWRWTVSTQTFDVSRYDGANWGIGANKVVQICNSFEISK